jgi:hypothetical protein
MPMKVEFTARLDAGNVTWDGPDGKPAKSHELHIGKGEPPQTIEFRLKDKTGLGLSFDEQSAFQIWEQDGCPPPGIATDQVELAQASSDTVRITNRNTGPERTLQYQLNVVGADGKKWPCDPIIRNDGGGPGFQ